MTAGIIGDGDVHWPRPKVGCAPRGRDGGAGKRFGEVDAVRGVDLSMPARSILASKLLGISPAMYPLVVGHAVAASVRVVWWHRGPRTTALRQATRVW